MSVYTVMASRAEEQPEWLDNAIVGSAIRGESFRRALVKEYERGIVAHIERHEISSKTAKCAQCKKRPARHLIGASIRQGGYTTACDDPVCQLKAENKAMQF